MPRKSKREPKRKPKYGMLSCVAYLYNMLWKYEKSLVFTGILIVPVSLVTSALALVIPSVILWYLETEHRFSTIALVIVGLVAADALFALMDDYLKAKTEMAEFYVVTRLQYRQRKSMLERDFYLDYDPEIKAKDERGMRSIESNHAKGVHFPMDFAEMAAVVVKFFFFGAVISVLDFKIILLLALGCAVNIPFYVWEQKRIMKLRMAETVFERRSIISPTVWQGISGMERISAFIISEPIFLCWQDNYSGSIRRKGKNWKKGVL